MGFLKSKDFAGESMVSMAQFKDIPPILATTSYIRSNSRHETIFTTNP